MTFLFARSLLRGNPRRNTFCIWFWCLTWSSYPGFTSNKPTHYLPDYGDFTHHITLKLDNNRTTRTNQHISSRSCQANLNSLKNLWTLIETGQLYLKYFFAKRFLLSFDNPTKFIFIIAILAYDQSVVIMHCNNALAVLSD